MPAALSRESWNDQARRLGYRHQCFIGNRFVSAASGKTFTCTNPATGKPLTQVSAGDKEDVDRAVKAARAAFEKGVWSRTAGAERSKVLLRLADLMEKHATELALLETLDVGKPIADSSSVDVPLSIQCIRRHAEAIDKIHDEIGPTAPNAISLIRREPLGVVGAVIPWNFPLLTGCWKIGPALATGNSMVVKPAEQSPLTMLRLAELAAEAGVPEGVFNVIPGYGEAAGQALGRHMDVDAITFTGSTGGKTPNIIMADAPDLDAAAEAAAWGIFFNQGEVCNAGSRLIVEESVKDAVLEKIRKVAQSLQPGDPLDPKTKMGAMVDETQMNRVLAYIESGAKEGARLAFGGKRVRSETGGYYIEPTVFDGVKSSMKIAQEEIFGPVLSTITFKDQAEAVKIGNDTIYGLAAAVWTSDINKAFKISAALRAGVVWVNCFDNGHISSRFGGFNQLASAATSRCWRWTKYTQMKAM
ncbi:MAG TPA: aldehyde dehydrogenase [Dongiaceae bacterium]|nr:aldehyde dehydrogenase [Dongiaceae bacterium]